MAAVLLDQPLDEFKPEAGESVPVGNHKMEFIPSMKSFQYGDEPFALPVEAPADIGDEFCVGVEFPHLGDLSVEVASLFGGTDPAVADPLGWTGALQVGIDVVESLSAGIAIEGDLSLVCISSQRGMVEAECLASLAAG